MTERKRIGVYTGYEKYTVIVFSLLAVCVLCVLLCVHSELCVTPVSVLI